MPAMQPFRIKTITEYHRATGLPKPQHPLISVIDLGTLNPEPMDGPISVVFDFYCITIKKHQVASVKYGQQTCDFDEGVLFCTAPGQVLSFEVSSDPSTKPQGWMILLHPDFLWNTALAKTIRQYRYFGYSVYEALYLSDKEETMITGIARYIEQEYYANIDQYTQSVIVAQLEVILTYAERFYQRQFLTRKSVSHQLVVQVEDMLIAYFNNDSLCRQGLPSVGYIADKLNVSAGYLSEMLKALTGKNTQQHIHDKLIDKAKEQLSATSLSVSEIAYGLGFEHLQSFSKLFKTKTNVSPVQFRQLFN